MSKEDIAAFWNRKPSANTQRHEAFNAFQTAVYPPRSKQPQEQQEEQQHRAPHIDTRAWRATPEFFPNSANSDPKQSSRETAYRQEASSIRPRQQQWPQQQWRDQRRTEDRNVQRWGTSQAPSRPHVNAPPTEERAAMIQQQQRAQQVQREAIVQPKQDRQIQLEDGVTVRQLASKLGTNIWHCLLITFEPTADLADFPATHILGVVLWTPHALTLNFSASLKRHSSLKINSDVMSTVRRSGSIIIDRS